jgi:DNA polymerase II small subunit/DNA polymerase delta subunit B
MNSEIFRGLMLQNKAVKYELDGKNKQIRLPFGLLNKNGFKGFKNEKEEEDFNIEESIEMKKGDKFKEKYLEDVEISPDTESDQSKGVVKFLSHRKNKLKGKINNNINNNNINLRKKLSPDKGGLTLRTCSSQEFKEGIKIDDDIMSNAHELDFIRDL